MAAYTVIGGSHVGAPIRQVPAVKPSQRLEEYASMGMQLFGSIPIRTTNGMITSSLRWPQVGHLASEYKYLPRVPLLDMIFY